MADKSISLTAAVQRVWEVALSQRIAGEAPQTTRELDAKEPPSQAVGGGFYLRWERGWALDAKLRVGVTVRDGELVLTVDVGWSSSGLPPPAARTAAALHSDVADLACWMQSVIDSMPAIREPK